MNHYTLVVRSGEGYTIFAEESQVPPEFSEKVLLLGTTKHLDFNGMVVYIKPNQSHILVPSDEYEEDYFSFDYFIFSKTNTKHKYVVFRPAYVNPSPFGLSLGDHPNGDNKPLRENGMRVMFHEEMSMYDRWWAWDARGNTLQNNQPKWSSGRNCVF